jgi:hypothetical protein
LPILCLGTRDSSTDSGPTIAKKHLLPPGLDK